MSKLLFLTLCILMFKVSKAQDERVMYIIEGVDTIPVVNLPMVNIMEMAPEHMLNVQSYYRLRFNVIKVYPYARIAAIKLQELEEHLKTLPNDRARKRYTKEFEKQLRKDFEQAVENLSVNQGKIFIKLIDRETGNSSFDLIKEMKGSFNAFVIQSAARIFGHNLKDKYDPDGEDKVIESIVREIESGEIN